MSINLTGNFSFETDDLGSMEEMLKTIVRIVFSRKTIHFEAGDSGWDDGGKYKETLPIYRIGRKLGSEQFATLKYGSPSHGCATAEIDSIFVDMKSAAEVIHKQRTRGNPTRKTIGFIKGDYPAQRTNGVIGWASCVKDCISSFSSSDKSAFFEYCGDGYNDGFNHFDGSIEMGYGVRLNYDFGAEVLQLYNTHIYYGK